ncbi:MltA domain-containing protein [Kiloniella laminariae]|uniref:peptidoglycan lytic exotransglycosylase n=1 Tax=Kiloniella laminariae TaxID=454162 RepID=A0ABT4LJA5_9PROT|nr:MltA domain-containing protein [Kiloniella laminariae]MCZ4281198.1 MltA domain-containing protein [Kiloniella laminariae]
MSATDHSSLSQSAISKKSVSLSSRGWRIGMLCLVLGLAACEGKDQATPPPSGTAQEDSLSLFRVDYAALPGWQSDQMQEAYPALVRSCGRFQSWPDSKTVGPDAVAGTAADWKPLCHSLNDFMSTAESPRDISLWMEENLVPYQVYNNDSREGTFTGYYEAELKGSLVQDATYKYPLYGVPQDLVSIKLSDFDEELKGTVLAGRVEGNRLIPYHDRNEIEKGVLDNKAVEVLWADDPVDVFFLHIQGSGMVTLPDGQIIRVGYAGNNGHKFYAIGRALIDEKVLPKDQVSMQSIRDWLRANPDKAREIMNRNKRFIFFRKIEGDGPIGAMGVPLTPARSLAVDPRFMPLGVPLWLDTTWPGSDRPLQRLMVAQDTGSAIRGPIRGDFFWGPGEAALAQAGGMKQKGSYYLLLPKSVAAKRDASS